MFGRKKKREPEEYDRENKVPVLHASICTGETVAGFRDKKSGKFEEVMLVRGDRDLQEFMDRYGLTEIPKKEY